MSQRRRAEIRQEGMALKPRAVKLFYDVLSPYTYIAFEVLTKCNKQWPSMDLQMKPVLISGVMQTTGNKPPGMLPSRANYMTKDLYRIAEYYKVDFKFPKDVFDTMFNKGSLKAQRLLTAISVTNPEHLEEVSRQLFRRIWLKDEDITEESSLKQACAGANVPNELTSRLIEMTSDDNIKEILKKSTAEATDNGVFGLPSYVIEHNGKSQMMFGTDRLFLLAHYLGEKWPIAKL